MLSFNHLRPAENARFKSLQSAYKLKKLLIENGLNVVTVESLTAGMISKTLVDIPSMGSVVYGGFTVYDTDAKRKFINVSTEGVYSHETAKEMASGALCQSRAMVAISVTGNAMPYPDHKMDLGEVWIGVALRIKGKEHHVETYNFKACRQNKTLCEDWKKLTLAAGKGGKPSFASISITSALADLIRLNTTAMACKFASDVIKRNLGKLKGGILKIEGYDSECKPSWIIESHLDGTSSSRQCDDHSTKSLRMEKSCSEVKHVKRKSIKSPRSPKPNKRK